MNANTIRFFSLTPINSAAQIQLELAGLGYTVLPAGTDTLDVLIDQDVPVRVILTTARDPRAQRDVMAFIEAASSLPDPNALAVLDALAKTQAVVVVRVPEGTDIGVVVDILDVCASLGTGLVEVDGEGFYEDGVLILRLN